MSVARGIDRPRLAYPIVLALGALDAAGYSVIAPVLPRIVQDQGIGPAVGGALVASFPLGIVLGFPLAGAAVRRWRVPAVLIGSLALLALGTAGFAFASDLLAYFAARFLMGIASGGLWIAVSFTTLELWPGEEYRCMSRVFAAYSVGGLLGPALGALGGARAPFVAYLCLVLLAIPLVRLLPRPSIAVEFRSDPAVLKLPGFWAASAAVLVAYLTLGLMEGVMPIHFAEHIGQTGLGLLYMALSVVVATAAAAAGRIPPAAMVVASAVLASIGVAAAGLADTPVPWIVALVVSGAGVGFGTTGSTGVLLETIATDKIVTALVVWSEAGIVGYAMGPLLGGPLAEVRGFGALALLPILGGIASIWTLRWSRVGATDR